MFVLILIVWPSCIIWAFYLISIDWQKFYILFWILVMLIEISIMYPDFLNLWCVVHLTYGMNPFILNINAVFSLTFRIIWGVLRMLGLTKQWVPLENQLLIGSHAACSCLFTSDNHYIRNFCLHLLLIHPQFSSYKGHYTLHCCWKS